MAPNNPDAARTRPWDGALPRHASELTVRLGRARPHDGAGDRLAALSTATLLERAAQELGRRAAESRAAGVQLPRSSRTSGRSAARRRTSPARRARARARADSRLHPLRLAGLQRGSARLLRPPCPPCARPRWRPGRVQCAPRTAPIDYGRPSTRCAIRLRRRRRARIRLDRLGALATSATTSPETPLLRDRLRAGDSG